MSCIRVTPLICPIHIYPFNTVCRASRVRDDLADITERGVRCESLANRWIRLINETPDMGKCIKLLIHSRILILRAVIHGSCLNYLGLYARYTRLWLRRCASRTERSWRGIRPDVDHIVTPCSYTQCVDNSWSWRIVAFNKCTVD